MMFPWVNLIHISYKASLLKVLPWDCFSGQEVKLIVSKNIKQFSAQKVELPKGNQTQTSYRASLHKLLDFFISFQVKRSNVQVTVAINKKISFCTIVWVPKGQSKSSLVQRFLVLSAFHTISRVHLGQSNSNFLLEFLAQSAYFILIFRQKLKVTHKKSLTKLRVWDWCL